MIKKHQKPNPATFPGGIIEKEAPIQASNVAIFNPATQRRSCGLQESKTARKYVSSSPAAK